MKFQVNCDGVLYDLDKSKETMLRMMNGWGVVGAHTKGYNTFSVGISFIGCFMRDLPPAISLRACRQIIQNGIDNGYIVPNYKLVAHCQCSPTESPGRKLFEEIQTWENFCADL